MNRDKFGVKDTFDMDLYTTKLPGGALSESKVRAAERIARSIEKDSRNLRGNIHMMQERGHLPEGDGFDEEALHSGVLRGGAAEVAARQQGTHAAGGYAAAAAAPPRGAPSADPPAGPRPSPDPGPRQKPKAKARPRPRGGAAEAPPARREPTARYLSCAHCVSRT